MFAQLSKGVCRSNIRWHGRSFAASVPSGSLKPHRGQKRLSRDERRARVVAYVDKYRALNAGQYPTPSAATKEVGGSYYLIKRILQELEYKDRISSIVKDGSFSEKVISKEECQPLAEAEDISSSAGTLDSQILQELEYKSRKPSISKDEAFLDKVEPKEESQSSTEAAEITSSEGTLELTLPDTTMEISEASYNVPEEKKSPLISSEKPSPGNALNPSGDHSNSDSNQIKMESKELLHLCNEKAEESGPKEETVQEAIIEASKSDLEASKSNREIMQESVQEASESDNFGRDVSREEKDEDSLLKRSTVWGNMRSFADGIINLWRKM